MSTRKEILERLANGEIDVTQAAELLNDPPPAAAAEPAAPQPARVPQTKPDQNGRRWLHIHVSDLETGRNRVRVNVPLGLVHFGLKVGARFTDEMDSDMMQNVLDAIKDTTISGTLVEVEDLDDNEHVHIFVD